MSTTRMPTRSVLDDFLDPHLAGIAPRPLPDGLVAARNEVVAAVRDLLTISDDTLTRPWPWTGGGEEELRYGFYRTAEAFERAGVDAAAAIREAGLERGRAADLIAPATAARWDLQGLLLPLPDAAWDADPGGGEWTIRQTLGHILASQAFYTVVTAWWRTVGVAVDDPALPDSAPDDVWVDLPSEEDDARGTPADVRARLDDWIDRSAVRLANVPAEDVALGARWSGFAVEVGFRLARWSSHLREHTIQVEKTLVMLDRRPTEVDRLIRLILATWGRAEAVVYGVDGAGPAVGILAAAADEARSTAIEIAALARD